jgi:hypothetical protein
VKAGSRVRIPPSPPPSTGSRPSGAGPVEQLQQVVGGQLDLLMAPLGRPVMAGDQAGPMQATEVAVDERVSCLGLLRRSLGETEMPLCVLVPGMRGEKSVLGFSPRLNVAPVAVEDVLACTD